MELTLDIPALRSGSIDERRAALVRFIHSWFQGIRTNPALVKLGIQFHNDPSMVRIAACLRRGGTDHTTGVVGAVPGVLARGARPTVG
mgnify:CR=1 FL=1